MGNPKGKKQGANVDHVKKPKEKSQSQDGAQSIQRAITILKAVATANEQGARLSTLARKVGLPTTTVFRILSMLNKERLLSYDPSTKLYNLGIELYALGAAAKNYIIIDQYRNALQNIAKETEDTTYLIIRSGNDSLCIERVEGNYPIRVLTLEPGDRRPLGIGGAGLALLAFLPDDQLESVMANNEGRFSAFKRTSEDIRKLVAKARKAGYAVSDGAMHPEMRAVGFPILNHNKELVCAISVGALKNRLSLRRCAEVARYIRSETKNFLVN